MYKKILSFLFIVVSMNLSAQHTETNEEGIQIGIKIIPSVDWLNVVNNDLHADGATLGIGYGAVVEYRMNSFLSLISGINYNNLGGFVFDNESLTNHMYKSSYNLTYSEIEIPLNLKLQTRYVYKTSYFLQGGVLAGILTKAEEIYFSSSTNGSNTLNSVSKLTNPLRIGYQAGAGAQRSIGKKSYLFGSIMFCNSISNVANSINYTTGINPRYTSSLQILPGNLEVSLGIMF